MRDELERRIADAIDREGGIDRDPELRAIVASDPEAAAYARDIGRLGRALREWPIAGIDDDAQVAALAARIEQRLDAVDQGPAGILPRIADPTQPPEFDDDDALGDATAGLLGPVLRSGEFDVEEYESHPPAAPSAAGAAPVRVIATGAKPKSVPPPPPPPRSVRPGSAIGPGGVLPSGVLPSGVLPSGAPRPISMIPKLRTASETAEERISFSHIPSTAPGALGSGADTGRRARAGWLAGLSAAAAVGIGVFMSTTMYDPASSPIGRESAPAAVQATPAPASVPEPFAEPPSAEQGEGSDLFAAEVEVATPTTATTTAAPSAVALADETRQMGGRSDPARDDLVTAWPSERRSASSSAPPETGAVSPVVAGVAPRVTTRSAAPLEGASAARAPEGTSPAREEPIPRSTDDAPETARARRAASGGGGGGAAGDEGAEAPRPAAAAPAEPEPESAPVDRSHLPETPDRDAVLVAIRSVEPAVRACAGEEHGVASVRIVVASSGRVTTAQVSGQFAGTPVGSCIARAVRTARFPEFQSERFEVTYPFQL